MRWLHDRQYTIWIKRLALKSAGTEHSDREVQFPLAYPLKERISSVLDQLGNRWFARLSAGGSRIRTVSPSLESCRSDLPANGDSGEDARLDNLAFANGSNKVDPRSSAPITLITTAVFG